MPAEYRVSGRRLRRTADPEASADPRVVAVLDQLRAIPAPPGPHDVFRAELRAQLVAITPRIVAESAAESGRSGVALAGASSTVGVLDRPRPMPRPRPRPAVPEAAGATRPVPSASTPGRARPPRESFWHRLREIPIGRPLGVVASLVTVLALVLGGAVWMSQDSLPGDTLYGLKRAGERFELSRTGNDTDRARKLLEFATTRVDEARQLVSRPSATAAGRGPLAAGGLSAHTSALVSDALASADDDTRTASRLLGTVAVRKASATPLAGVATWASGQLHRLTRLRDSIPASATARSRAAESSTLVQAVARRAGTLRGRVSCDCLRKAPSDSLGPVPVTSSGSPRHSAPSTGKPGTHTGSPRTHTSSTPRRPGGTGTSGGRTTTHTTAPRTTSGAPTAPLPSVSLPVSSPTRKPLLDLCKVTLLGIRLCPSSTP